MENRLVSPSNVFFILLTLYFSLNKRPDNIFVEDQKGILTFDRKEGGLGCRREKK